MTPGGGHVHDVAIVGLGPTGATLACLLAKCGLDVLAMDRQAGPCPEPRAVHFDDEVMRVFQTIGLAEAVEGVSRINPGMRFVDAGGSLLLDWPRPADVGPMGWHASYRFHQPDLEGILRAAVARANEIQVLAPADATDIIDRGDHVDIRLSTSDGTDKRSVSARYVVGCDGARSTVRSAIGTGHHDLGFNERWLVVDALLTAPQPHLGDHTIQHCNPERPATYVRGPGDRRRWEIALKDGERAEDMTSDEVLWPLLSGWLSPQVAVLERRAVYTFHSTIARTWRRGRLMIAGDAAHQTPPFMGQGMCAGIRDAANLGWKLAAVVRGADPSLLDTYGEERIPHVRAYIETAIRLGGLINASGTKDALQQALPRPDGSARMSSIAPPLGRSKLLGSGEKAGRLCPQPRLSGGERLDDACGYGHALLTTRHEEHAVEPPHGRAAVFCAGDHPEIGTLLDEFGCGAILVRPDRYIAATGPGLSGLGRYPGL